MTDQPDLRAAVAAGVVGSEASHRALLNAIVEVARSIFGAKASSILLLDEATEELVFEAVVGEGEDTLLGTRFPADRLADFDTAIKELQLDTMERLATAAEREADMLRVANGKPVHAVTVLGWQARRARFLREIAELDRMLARDLAQKEKTAATGTPDAVLRRIASEREVLEQLHGNLTATEQRLTELTPSKH